MHMLQDVTVTVDSNAKIHGTKSKKIILRSIDSINIEPVVGIQKSRKRIATHCDFFCIRTSAGRGISNYDIKNGSSPPF